MALSDAVALELEIKAKSKAGADQFVGDTERVAAGAQKAEGRVGLLGKAMAGGFVGAAIFNGVAKALDLFTDVLGASIAEAAQGEAVYRQLEAAVISTGGAAGRSATQLSDLATQLQRTSTFADDVIMGAEGILLSFTRVKGANFDRAMQLVLDVSERTGAGLEETARKVGTSLNDPATAFRALRTLGVALSESQKDLIKTLAATGDRAGAQAIILRELESRYGGAAAAARDTFAGSLKAAKNEINDLLEAVGQGIVPVLKNLTLMLAENGPQWLRWATMIGRAIGAVISAAGLLAGSVVAAVGKVMQSFASFFQRFSAFFGLLGKIPAVRELMGPLSEVGTEIEALGKSLSEAGAQGFVDLLTPIPQVVAELKTVPPAADGAARSLDEITESAKKLINHGLRLKEFARLTSDIKFTVDVEGAMDGVLAKQRLLIDIKEKSGALSADEARILRDQLGVQQLINQAKAEGIPLTEETIKKMMDGVSTVGAEMKKSFDWQKYVAEPGKQAWEDTKSYALDAIAAIVSGQEVDFKAMFKNLLQMWIRTLAEMVARALQAKLAQTAMGSSSGGSVGGGGGNLAGTAAGGSQAASAAGMGTAATVLGVVAIFAAIYMGVDSWIKKQRAKRFGSSPEMEVGLIGGKWGSTELTKQASEVAKGIKQMVAELEKQLGGIFTDLPAIALNWRADGKKVRAMVEGVFIGEFDDVREAISAALAVSLKGSTIKADSMIQDLLKNTFASTMEELGAQLDTVQKVLGLAMSPLEAEIKQTIAGFDRLRAELVKLPLSLEEVTRGLGILNKAEEDYWRSQYDQITGRKKTKAEQLEDLKKEAEMFNAQRRLRLAELESKRLGLITDRENLLAAIRIQEFKDRFNRDGIDRDRAFLGAKAALLEAEGSLQLQYLQAQLAALDAQLAALDSLMAAIAAIPDIDPNKIKLPRSGGGGGGKDAALGLIQDAARNQLPAFAQQLFDLNKRFDDAAKGIKNNADLLAKLNKARQDEIDLLKKQVKDQYAPYLKDWGKSGFRSGIDSFLRDLKEIPDQLLSPFEKALIKARFLKEQSRDVTERIKEFGGDFFPTAAIDDVRDTAKGLRDDLAALAAQGIDVSGRLRLVAEAEKYRLQQIEFGLVDTLFGYLKGSAEWGAKAVEFEKQKVQLQFAVIEAQLRSLGVWEKYEGLFNAAFKAAMDAAGQITASSGGSSFESSVSTFADVIKEATDRWRNATRQIADFYRNLIFGNQSPLTGVQTVEAALAAYNSTAALARGGNLGAREQFTTVAQTLLDVLDRAYGSTEFSARLRAQVAADSQQLLGQTTFNEGGVTYNVSWSTLDRSIQDGNRRLVEAVQQAQASQTQGSQATTAAVVNLAQAILTNNGEAASAELVSALERIAVLLEAEARRNAA